MKIDDIDVFVLKTALDTPFASSQAWINQRCAVLVRIVSDNGLVGWGEAFTQGGEPPEIAAAALEHAFKPGLIGRDPREINVLWHEMITRSRDYGRKGSVVSAISGIDMALWDLAGYYYQEPLHRLLGGAFRNAIQPYATGFFRIKGRGEAARLAEEALRHREDGFRAMKIKLGFGLHDDVQVMQAIVDALDDQTIELMVDVNHAYGRSEAVVLGRKLEPFNLRWLEEPVVPEDIAGYSELRKRIAIPIAGGENEHTLFGFYPLIKASAIDIAQPDVGSCGGITGMRDIASIAHAAGVAVNPHVWGSAVSQAASVHVMACLPPPHARLLPESPLFEYDCSSHPFRQELVSEPLQLHDGMILLNDRPGLGVEIRMEVVEAYLTRP